MNEKLDILSEKYENLISGTDKVEKTDNHLASDSPDGNNQSKGTKKPCMSCFTVSRFKHFFCLIEGGEEFMDTKMLSPSLDLLAPRTNFFHLTFRFPEEFVLLSTISWLNV